MTLQLGLFENFKGRKTLLIWGDKALGQFQATLLGLAESDVTSISLHERPWVAAKDGLQVLLTIQATDHVELSQDDDGPIVKWHGSRRHFSEVADKIAPLLKHGTGHQYVDFWDDPQFQIIISKGEYPADLSPRLKR